MGVISTIQTNRKGSKSLPREMQYWYKQRCNCFCNCERENYGQVKHLLRLKYMWEGTPGHNLARYKTPLTTPTHIVPVWKMERAIFIRDTHTIIDKKVLWLQIIFWGPTVSSKICCLSPNWSPYTNWFWALERGQLCWTVIADSSYCVLLCFRFLAYVIDIRQEIN